MCLYLTFGGKKENAGDLTIVGYRHVDIKTFLRSKWERKENQGKMGCKSDAPPVKEYVFSDLYLHKDCLLSMPAVCSSTF